MSKSPPQEQENSSGNRFTSLPLDTPGDIEQPKKDSKPPPLILYGVQDVCKLKETLESTLEKNQYTFKMPNQSKMIINCASIESYRKLMTLAREKNIIGHTFTDKRDKCYRIVIKHLHHTTPHSAIIEEILKTGNVVKGEIINARVGPEKNPSSTFFVNILPGPNNKEVKNIRYIFNTSVKIEDPKKTTHIVQCTRCQQYGHTKNNCLRPYRCVKCAGAHKTSDCQKKDRNSPAKCALCQGSHPANHKGCEVYKEILARRNKGKRVINSQGNHLQTIQEQASNSNRFHNLPPPINNNKTLPPFNEECNQLGHSSHIPPQPSTSAPKSPERRTYADCLRNNNESQKHFEPTQVLRDFILQQSQKMDTLLQQISSLMGLLITLIDKMSK